MEVILIEKVDGLGDRGNTVRVAPGYARNFLLPRKLAIPAKGNAANHFKTLVKQAELRDSKLRGSAEASAAKLDGVKLTVKANAGEEGVLFGSVTSSHLSEELGKLGHEVDRRHIDIAEPIKRLGEFEVKVRFAAGVTATIPVEVVAE